MFRYIFNRWHIIANGKTKQLPAFLQNLNTKNGIVYKVYFVEIYHIDYIFVLKKKLAGHRGESLLLLGWHITFLKTYFYL